MATQEVTSPTNPTKAALTAEQQACLFEEIATLAHRAERICFFGPVVGELSKTDPSFEASVERAALLVTELRDLIARIGLFADMGLQMTGDPGVVGGIEEWLLPPVYPKGGDVANNELAG